MRLLLEHGADPNGCPMDLLSSWNTRFLRFRPHLNEECLNRTYILEEIVRAGYPAAQDAPLTEQEVLERRQHRAAFWTEISIPPERACISMRPEPLALEMAARTGDCELIDMLCAGGADIQAWVQKYDEIPAEPSASYLCTTTPLHITIERGDIPTTKHLLQKGFSGSVFPLASITVCLNPVMASIVLAPDNKLETYEAVSPYADLELRSPIFDVHLLHHAVATLDLNLILRVEADVPLSSAGKTALGHTLLHIACLPRDQKQLNSISPEIDKSIHDLRTIPESPKPPPRLPVRSHTHQTQPKLSRQEFLDSLTTEFAAQVAVISHLLSSAANFTAEEISAQDIHGNTALHYLASYVVPNEGAITVLKTATTTTKKEKEKVDSSSDDWTTLRNNWGLTAQQLYTFGQEAIQGWKERGGTSSWSGQIQRHVPERWRAARYVPKYELEAQAEAKAELERLREKQRGGLVRHWRSKMHASSGEESKSGLKRKLSALNHDDSDGKRN